MPKDTAAHKRPLLEADGEAEVRAGVPVDMTLQMERDFINKVSPSCK